MAPHQKTLNLWETLDRRESVIHKDLDYFLVFSTRSVDTQETLCGYSYLLPCDLYSTTYHTKHEHHCYILLYFHFLMIIRCDKHVFSLMNKSIIQYLLGVCLFFTIVTRRVWTPPHRFFNPQMTREVSIQKCGDLYKPDQVMEQ